MTKTMGKPKTRALSVRQPFAELIMRRIKKVEYRPMLTHIRERVYVYASKAKTGSYAHKAWRQVGLEEGDLPTGVIVGSVELTKCTGRTGDYRWHLAHPQRAKTMRRPTGRPQPSFFFPF